MSALILDVHPQASPAVVTHRLARLLHTKDVSDLLTTGACHLPSDPYQARLVAAARVLVTPPARRSRAVIAFLTADNKVPEHDQLVHEPPDKRTGQQLSLL